GLGRGAAPDAPARATSGVESGAGVPTPQGKAEPILARGSTGTGSPDRSLAGVSAAEAREPRPAPAVAPDGHRTSGTCTDPGESEPLTLLSDEVGVEG